MLHGIRERLRGLVHRDAMEQEMDEEFHYHLEASIQRNIERGLEPAEARRQALRDFGGVERRKEQTRREWGFRWLSDLGQDVHYALRYFRANPGFVAVAVLVMGLGIGANSAIYSVVDSVLFRALPVQEPDRVVRVYVLNPGNGLPQWNAFEDYEVMRGWDDLFERVTAVGDLIPFTYVTGDGAETVLAEVHGASFLPIVGLSPALGRGFLPEEDLPGSDLVVMISWRRWQRRHGGDPDIIGQTIRLNGFPVKVVGIGPKEVTSSWLGVISDYWVPWGTGMLIDPGSVPTEGRGDDQCPVFARLRPGVGPDQVQARLDALASSRAEEYPDTDSQLSFKVFRETEIRVDPMLDIMMTPVALFLMIVVTLVLLVACSNLAGLLMMRGSVRQREIAIRLAMGAGRGRLLRQLLTESLLLGLLGGIVGLAIAGWVSHIIVDFKPPLPVPVAVDLRVDGSVFLYTLVIALLTGLVFGLFPALRASRPRVIEGLKGISRLHLDGNRRFSLRNGLIVFQVAVSVVLLIGATLFLRSIDKGRNTDPGFSMEGLAYVLTDVAQGGYRDEDAGRDFYARLLERASALPGVDEAALSSHTPLSIWGISNARVRPPEVEVERLEEMRRCQYIAVSPAYFSTIGVGLLAGRGFSDALDTPTSPRVAIVNETLARQLWDSSQVVGRTFMTGVGADADRYEVVGVVRDVKERLIIDDEYPMFYLPLAQRYRSSLALIARTGGQAEALRGDLRRVLEELDRDVPVYEARTMLEQMDFHLFVPRIVSGLLSILGFVALLLSTIGLYGIVAFALAQRTREIGIRMALGAGHREVVRMLMREGSGLAITGLVVGLVLSALVMQVLTRLLFGVSPLDPLSYLAVILVLLGATTLANWLPARRCVHLNPVETLRNE